MVKLEFSTDDNCLVATRDGLFLLQLFEIMGGPLAHLEFVIGLEKL